MSVDHRELAAFLGNLEEAKKDVPAFMNQCAVGEGSYAMKQAKLICKNDSPDIVNTGDYRRNFESGTTAVRNGDSYKIDVWNNLDYAKPLEYGFRSHFVPGHWDGNSFVYQRKDPAGGMYVGPPGGYVRGHFTLRRAIKRTKDTQEQRLRRKMETFLRSHGLEE